MEKNTKQLSEQLNANPDNSSKETYSEELLNFQKVDGTMFTIVEDKTKEQAQYFVTLGSHMLTHPKDTKEECLKLIEERDWHLIGTYIIAMCTHIKENH